MPLLLHRDQPSTTTLPPVLPQSSFPPISILLLISPWHLLLGEPKLSAHHCGNFKKEPSASQPTFSQDERHGPRSPVTSQGAPLFSAQHIRRMGGPLQTPSCEGTWGDTKVGRREDPSSPLREPRETRRPLCQAFPPPTQPLGSAHLGPTVFKHRRRSQQGPRRLVYTGLSRTSFTRWYPLQRWALASREKAADLVTQGPGPHTGIIQWRSTVTSLWPGQVSQRHNPHPGHSLPVPAGVLGAGVCQQRAV